MMDSLDIPILVSRENGPSKLSKQDLLNVWNHWPMVPGISGIFAHLQARNLVFQFFGGVHWPTFFGIIRSRTLENLPRSCPLLPPPKGPQKERILVFQLYHFFFWGGKLAVKLLGCNKIGTIFLNDPAVWTTNLIPANGKSSFNLGRVSERLQVIKNKYGTGHLPLVPCHQDSCQPDFIIFDTC